MSRHALENFFGNEGNERVHQPQNFFEDVVQHGKRVEFLTVVIAVEHRFRGFDIPVAEIAPDEIVKLARRKTYFVFIKVNRNLFHDVVEPA